MQFPASCARRMGTAALAGALCVLGSLLVAQRPAVAAEPDAAARKPKGDAQMLVTRALEAADKATRPGANPRDTVVAYTMLEKALAAAPDNMEVVRRLADLSVKEGRVDAARTLLQRLVREFPEESELAVKLARCQFAVDRVHGAMDTLNGVILRDPRCHEAYVALAQLYRDKLDNADRADAVIDEMVAADPGSAGAYVRRGEYWKRARMPQKAKADFARALELAPRDLDTLLAAADFALDGSDFAAARQFLARAEKKSANDPRVRRMRLKETMALRKTDEALAMLRQMGDEDSRSPVDLLTLADLLLQKRDLDGVREVLKRMRKAGFRAEVFDYYEARLRGAEGKWRETADILERLRPKVADWPEFATTVELALATCYAELKMPDRAAEILRKLLEKDSKLVAARVGLASVLLRSGKVEAGLGEYRKLEQSLGTEALRWEPRLRDDLRQLLVARTIRPAESQSDNMRWARRTLAAILAEGTYREQETAVRLLDENAGDSEPSIEDLRWKAGILGRQPLRKSRLAAVEVLHQLGRRKHELDPAEQFVLAQLYDQTGRWALCRKEMERLIERYPGERRYLAGYIEMLLKHEAPANDIAVVQERLEELQPESSVTCILGARLLARQGKSEAAVRELEGLIPRTPPADRPQIRRQVARLLENLEQYEAAGRLLRQIADEEPGGRLALAAFLGRQGKIGEALDECVAVQKDLPGTECVSTAVSVLTAQRQRVTPQQLARVERWIQALITRDPQSHALTLQLAALCDLQGKYDEQSKIYRDLLARSDLSQRERAVVQNNLAYLLMLEGKDLKQALEMSGQAVDVIGPAPELLDTRAMVYLAAGEPQKAIADLRESLADTPAAMPCFHLALAHQAAGQGPAARACLQTAREKHGLTAEQVPRPERKRFEAMVNALGGPAAQSP